MLYLWKCTHLSVLLKIKEACHHGLSGITAIRPIMAPLQIEGTQKSVLNSALESPSLKTYELLLVNQSQFLQLGIVSAAYSQLIVGIVLRTGKGPGEFSVLSVQDELCSATDSS